jgi:4'-phosphopantetheinyl transferase
MENHVLHPVVLTVPQTVEGLSRKDKVTALRDHARRALHRSAEFSGFTLTDLRKDDLGAPLPEEGIHWSISHKDILVAAVAAPYRIGIDIEMVKPIKPELCKRIADAQEWDLAGGENETTFFRFWTAKEAALKAIGKGMTALSDCRITAIIDETHLILSIGGRPWNILHHWTEKNHLAALTTRGETIIWHLPAGKEITCT